MSLQAHDFPVNPPDAIEAYRAARDTAALAFTAMLPCLSPEHALVEADRVGAEWRYLVDLYTTGTAEVRS